MRPRRAAPVAMRAELDGLPIAERTGAPLQRDGRDDARLRARRAHGGARRAARAAHGSATRCPSPLLAIFQPSEEAYPSGAEQLARAELAGARARGRRSRRHIHPELPWGTVALDAGAVNASCDAVEITIAGEPSHGAYPHRGRDPILALAQIVRLAAARVGRRVDPLHPATLTSACSRAAARRT